MVSNVPIFAMAFDCQLKGLDSIIGAAESVLFFRDFVISSTLEMTRRPEEKLVKK